MKQRDIVMGETYTFVATDSQQRKYLEGQPFTVLYKKAVFRKFKRKGTRKVNRFFNEDGVGARAEELEPQAEAPSAGDQWVAPAGTCSSCGGGSYDGHAETCPEWKSNLFNL